jgi:hypothetical protein
LQYGVSGLGNLDPKLAPVGGVSCPRDQPAVLQAGEDAAERLALNMNLCGELLLVQGAGRHGFQSDDGGTRQSQRRQGVVVEALDQAGRCGQKPVSVAGVGLRGEDHKENLPDWGATKSRCQGRRQTGPTSTSTVSMPRIHFASMLTIFMREGRPTRGSR